MMVLGYPAGIWNSSGAKGTQISSHSLALQIDMRIMPHARPVLLTFVVIFMGCSRPTLPDPRTAALEFAQAAKNQDADAIYSMLSREAQEAYGQKGTRLLVDDQKKELRGLGRALSQGKASVSARARLRFADGEEAVLQAEDGRFLVSAAGSLPAGASTPTDALLELRRVLARRSYSGLMRVLSKETRSAMEADLRSLVTGLDHAESLDIVVDGDRAEVVVPGGHRIKLKREDGEWRVDDFD